MGIIPPRDACGTGETHPDVEWEVLCDSGTDPYAAFLRKLITDVGGDIVSSTDYELDGITPYSPIGEAVVCPATINVDSIVIGNVALDLPEVSVVDCEGNETLVEALPVAVQGSVDAKLCESQFPIPVDIGSFPASVEISNDIGNPVPVSGTVTITDGAGPVTVDGSVNVSNFPASTEVSNDVGNPIPVSDAGGSLTVDGTVAVSNFPAIQPVSDAGGSLTVDGIVSVLNFPATQDVNIVGSVELEVSNDTGNPLPVAISNFPVAQDVNIISSVELEIKNDSGNPVPISDAGGSLTIDGTVTVQDGGGSISVDDSGGSITVDGTVAVSNFPASVEVSNDVGNPLPISGTVTITDGSGPVTVDGTVNVGNFPAVQPVSDNGGSLTVDGTVSAAEAKAEDAIAATGDLGIPILAVRNDTAATKTSADGDYSTLATDAAGRVGISDLGGSISIDDNGGSLTVDGIVFAPVSSSASPTSVAASASSVTLLASNASRLGGSIYNDSLSTLYIKTGTTASTTSFTVKVPGDGYWEIPFNYTGRIDGIWGIATGSARVAEYIP